MSWFEKIIERVTHRRALEEEIAQLRQRLEFIENRHVANEQVDALEEELHQLQQRFEALENNHTADERLEVLELDRTTLFSRVKEIWTQLDVLRDSNKSMYDHIFLEEKRLDEGLEILDKKLQDLPSDLWRQIEKVERKLDPQRFTVLEQDRTELFQRVDKLLGDHAAMRDIYTTSVARLAVLEEDRTELFGRCDQLYSTLSSRQQEDVLSTVVTLQNSLENIWTNIPTYEHRQRIHFIRCIDIYNAGDRSAGPELYFRDFLESNICYFHSIKHVNFEIIGKHDWVILGSGGMLGADLLHCNVINRLLEINDHVIGWGLGINEHRKDCVLYWPIDRQINYNKFFLYTTRDWMRENIRFCPCVSCMMDGLLRQYPIKRKIGVLQHHEIPINEFDFEICDNSQPIDIILEFIGSSEVVLTNTYHCTYWATLMNKKVILYMPFSNKFDFLKYPAVIYSGDLEADIQKAKTYPEALQECRDINIALKNELLQLIKREAK